MKIWMNLIDVARDSAENPPPQKPHYQSPTVISYQTQKLMRQLGPARAYSHDGTHGDDEFALFGTMR